MKLLNAFTISIEKCANMSNETYRSLFVELNQKPEKERTKELRKEIKSYKIFYKIQVTHKNTKETSSKYVFDEKLVLDEVVSLCKDVIFNIRRKRESLKELKTKRKTYKKAEYWLTGLVHTEPNTITRIAKYAIIQKYYNSKKPKTSDRHVGVELELYIPKKHEMSFMYDLYELNPATLDKVCIKDDGSLRPKSDESDLEIAIVDTESNINKTVSDVLLILNKYNARVDKHCGLHVHLDMRDRIAEVVFHNLSKAQNLLFKLLDKSRKTNSFCTPVKGCDIYNYYDSRTKYHSINATAMKKFRTIEVRMHQGTVDADRVNNWVNVLIKIANNEKKVKKSYRAISSVAKDFNLPKTVVKYSKEIIKQELAS